MNEQDSHAHLLAFVRDSRVLSEHLSKYIQGMVLRNDDEMLPELQIITQLSRTLLVVYLSIYLTYRFVFQIVLQTCL